MYKAKYISGFFEKELALLRKDEYNAGVKAGVKKGQEEGMKMGVEEVALRMLSMGNYTREEIAEVSGLDEKEIQKLEKQKTLSEEKI